jgi:hypothetical protein
MVDSMNIKEIGNGFTVIAAFPGIAVKAVTITALMVCVKSTATGGGECGAEERHYRP